MIGYKAFEKDLTCRGFQYIVGEVYEFDGSPIPCEQGFHFCKSIGETYIFYPEHKETRICKVEALGDISTDDGIKYCTNKIKIIKEITEEWIKKGNTNSSSNGYCNTSNYNTGNRNTGNRNTGSCNTGYRNTGNHNTGEWNIGSCNTGGCNTGDCNTGSHNTGYRNTGYHNTGDCNTGNWNSGNCNSGDWNISNYNTGCFNSEENNIMMFNKMSNWTFVQWKDSRAYYILNNIPKNLVKWIDKEYMSKKEKENHPSYKTTRGYLKILNEKDIAQEYWNALKEKDRQEILNLPNFDPEIFKKCTGIDVTYNESLLS